MARLNCSRRAEADGEINVIVVDRKRKNLYLRYTDPVTGRDVEKSARTSRHKDAIKKAGEWQLELNAGLTTTGNRMSWDRFRDDFFESHVNHLSEGYQNNVFSTFCVIEDLMAPDRLTRVTSEWLKRFRQKVVHKPEATVHKYFQHLKTALTHARDQGYIKELPRFPKLRKGAAKRKKHMKGRPITAEEYDRIVDKCEHESMRNLLEGLWLSGLRLGEALALTWDEWADGIRIKIDGSDVTLLIDSDDQKNRTTIEYPVVDAFAEFLLRTPPEHRTGVVFAPQGSRKVVSRRVDTVSDWIVAIGKKAVVRVDMKTVVTTDGKTEQKPMYASAHDFRRAFGARWAKILPPMLLKDLMRHASVSTTEQFYVGVNAKSTVQAMRKYLKASGEVTHAVTPKPTEQSVAPETQQKH